MKYFIAYKQNGTDYIFVNSIGSTIGKTMTYYNAIDFLTKENAQSICNFLNELDGDNKYIVIKYSYSLEEE